MRFVIDLQCCQGDSGVRGIGRYSLSLAKAMSAQAQGRGHEVLIVLNSSMPDAIDQIKGEFSSILPAHQIHVFECVGPTRYSDVNNCNRASVAEAYREQFIARLNPDVVHVASAMEGFVDDVVVSTNEHVQLSIAVTLYDLIPHMLRDMYIVDRNYESFYYRRLASMKNARAFLAISEHSRQEAISVLAIDPERVTNISAAIDPSFRKTDMTVDERNSLFRRYRLRDGFMLYVPGGFDPRKNFERLLHAYALLPANIRSSHQLVIGSKIYPGVREAFAGYRARYGINELDVILTDYMPDDDLIRIYNSCRLHVFPSLHEGFGLPALEGLACGAATIASSTTSLPEVIGRDDALFDPYSEESISKAMHRALTDHNFRASLMEHATAQAAKFSWNRSARLAIEHLERIFQRGTESDARQISG